MISQPKPFLVEVCVDSLEAALIAEKSGADRLELNLALELDGLTPSPGLVQSVLEQVNLPVITMVRPRSGDFFYRPDEWTTMLRSAAWLLEAGVAGVAFGALNDNRTVDRRRCHEIRALVADRELVFHKAFDEIADWSEAGQQLIDIGIDRVMTSGRAAGCLAGVPAMQRLRCEFGGRLSVLPAGGISATNVVEVLEAVDVDQVHGSFSGGNPRDFPAIEAEIGAAVGNLKSHFNQ
jgi:copper homeostasis protein